MIEIPDIFNCSVNKEFFDYNFTKEIIEEYKDIEI